MVSNSADDVALYFLQQFARAGANRQSAGILSTFTGMAQSFMAYGQITRNRKPLEYSWSPALSHQQSSQLHTFLRVEIQGSRCGATYRSHSLYAPIFLQLKVGVPTLLARMKQRHNAVGMPSFRVC